MIHIIFFVSFVVLRVLRAPFFGTQRTRRTTKHTKDTKDLLKLPKKLNSSQQSPIVDCQFKKDTPMIRFKESIILFLIGCTLVAISSCKKEKSADDDLFQYYEVGFKSATANWRDTAFIVRTLDAELIQEIEAQLLLPVANRQIVTGALVAGSGGYNKNATHEFKWHFKEDDWKLADVTIEIYDGKPFTDVDQDISYWLNTVKRFGSWGSYIRRKLPGKP